MPHNQSYIVDAARNRIAAEFNADTNIVKSTAMPWIEIAMLVLTTILPMCKDLFQQRNDSSDDEATDALVGKVNSLGMDERTALRNAFYHEARRQGMGYISSLRAAVGWADVVIRAAENAPATEKEQFVRHCCGGEIVW